MLDCWALMPLFRGLFPRTFTIKANPVVHARPYAKRRDGF